MLEHYNLVILKKKKETLHALFLLSRTEVLVTFKHELQLWSPSNVYIFISCIISLVQGRLEAARTFVILHGTLFFHGTK
jgi:hypothetical protein